MLKFIKMTFGFLSISPRAGGKLAYYLFKKPLRTGKVHFDKLDKIGLNYKRETFVLDGSNKKVSHYYFGAGSGPTILLVHGWNSFASSFHHVVKYLELQKYNVIAVDLPAHGNSEGDCTDIEEAVTTLLQLQNKYGSFHSIIGHSFGGVATAYAITKGLKTKSLILLNTPESFKTLVDVFSNQLQIKGRIRHFLDRNIENHFPKLKQNIWTAFSTTPNLSIEINNFPIMIIQDSDDEMIPKDEGLKLSTRLPKSKFIQSSGYGHNGILRDRATIKNCIAFIKQQELVETDL